MHSADFILIFLMRSINLTSIVLTIIAPEFDLVMSFGKVKSGKSLKIYTENCVGTLYTPVSSSPQRRTAQPNSKLLR